MDKKKLSGVAKATVIAGALCGVGMVDAENSYAFFGSGAELRSALIGLNKINTSGSRVVLVAQEDKSDEGKCGEGKCGEEGEDEGDDKSGDEAKCGEGKCGE